jgi:hypothetical protein
MPTKQQKSALQQDFPKIPKGETPVNILNERTLEEVNSMLIKILDNFRNIYVDVEFPKKNPVTKIGHGVRNYGFVEKTRDLMRDNPKSVPDDTYYKRYALHLNEFEQIRQLCIMSQELTNEIKKTEILMGNKVFEEALGYYNYLKALVRIKFAGGAELLGALSEFFKKKKPDIQRPTEKQLKRDFDAIVHGKKDGKIVVENISPKKTKGVHIVEDDVYKSSETVKVKVDEEE